MADCAFCEIVSGARAADVVLEDEYVVSFLDHRPVFPGHLLLVPRRHVPAFDDLPDELLTPLFSAARRLSRALQMALQADGSFIGINNLVSQSVPHVHIHLVPRRRGDGLRGFFWPRHRYPDDSQRFAVAQAIRNALAGS